MADNCGRRIFIWSMMRSVSTAFMRCFMNLGENNKGILEPFWRAHYFGDERQSPRYEGTSDIRAGNTFQDVKSYLQGPFDGHDYVVVKDLAFYMKGRTHLPDAIPDGYIYMFLIRHPAKAITSLHNLIASGKMKVWKDFTPDEVSYKELVELYDLVSKKMGVAPVVVDADDLLENPEKMLKEVCRLTGIPYCDEMFRWKPLTSEQMDLFKQLMPFMENMVKSNGLEQKPASPAPDVSQLPDNVQKAISDAMPYYLELHCKRLKVD